jgi:glycerol kinase
MGAALQELKVDGGLTQSAALMQLQADLAQVPVSVYGSAHATAIGVATLARVGAGFDPELQPPVLTGGARFEPRMSPETAAERLTTWEHAVHRVVENAEAS